MQEAAEWKAKGNQAFKDKNWPTAIEAFTNAIECNPNDHVFFSNRSAAFLNNGEYDSALQDAQKCVEMNPGWSRGYQRKGTALFYLNRIDDSIASYEEGLKIDPNNADLQKDLSAAKQKKSSAGKPQQPQMNPAYLNAILKLMNHPETKELFSDPNFMQNLQAIMANPALAQVFMQQDPRFKKVFDILSQQTSADDMQNLQKMYKESMGGQAGAGPQEKKEESYSPPPPPPPPKKEEKKPEKMQVEDPAQQMKEKGNQEFKKRNFNQALNFYDEAIKLNGNQPLYYNNKAAAYIEMKEYDNALEQITRAEKLFDEGVVKDFVKKAKILTRKGTIFGKLEKYDEAINCFEKSLLEDNNQKTKDELKRMQKLKKEKEAKEYINPEIAQKNCEQGNALYKEGKFPQAVKEYEEAIKRNPEVAKYYSNLGQVYIKLMEFGRAKESYQTALAKDPNFVKAYHKKGDCHFLMKEYHKALQCYEQGLKIDPNNVFCKQGLQKTQQAIYMGGGSQEEQEERAKHAMADPQIQAILQTPEVRNALSELERDPKSLPNILKNKNIAEKLQKLIQAGILRVG